MSTFLTSLRMTALATGDALTDVAHRLGVCTKPSGDEAGLRLAVIRAVCAAPASAASATAAVRGSLTGLATHELSFVDDWLLDVLRKHQLLDARAAFECWGGTGRMTLLDMVGNAHIGSADLSDAVLVAVQHLLGSNVAVFAWLIRLGLAPARMIVLGKSYSEHAAAVWELRRMGITVWEDESLPREAVSSQQRRFHETTIADAASAAIERALAAAAPMTSKTRVILMDDGGQLIRTAARPRFRKAWPRFAAVEQTSRGRAIAERLGSDGLRIPVIDVARSRSKHELESPLIGMSVAECALPRCRALRRAAGIEDTPNVLVVGYGMVGSWTYAACRSQGYPTRVFDSRLAKPEDADTFADVGSGLRWADVIIGCTGNPWFGAAKARALKAHAIVVSASTADVEFGSIPRDRNNRVLMARAVAHLPDTRFALVHADYRVHADGGCFYVTNGGYPCNFDGRLDPIDPQWIQVTRALMLAGVCQAASASEPAGIHPLATSADAAIYEEFRRIRRGLVTLPQDPPRLL